MKAKMISLKSNREIELMKHAGHINYLAHREVAKHIKPGVTTGELNDVADKFMRSMDATPSCLGYEGFPKSVCISVNDEVVHGIPGNRVIKDGDIVSVDMVTCYKGYHSDSTETHIVGNVPDDVKNLVANTEKALYEGLKVIKAGVKVNEIGKAVQNYAESHGLSVVRELVGHGIGSEMHEMPDVPNFYTNSPVVLKEGMTIAVEPMLNLGERYVYLDDNDWTIKTQDGKYSAHFEHTVLVTKDGYEILTGE